MSGLVPGADVDLVISDIDNTLIDLCNQWERLTTPFLRDVTTAMGPRATEIILANVGDRTVTGRIHAFPDAARRVLEESGLWRQAAEAERRGFEAAAHRWYAHRDRDAEAYPGVVDTIAAIKQSGRSFAIHTDAKMLAALVRLKSAGIPGALIDRVYAQPDPGLGERETLRAFLRQSPDPYLAAFADRAIPLAANSYKHVSKTNTADICRDFAVPPARALHVGDNLCDAETALNAGASFAWQEEGAWVAEPALELQQRAGLTQMPGHDEIGRALATLGAGNPEFRQVRLSEGFAGLSAVLALPAPAAEPAEEERDFSFAPGL